MKIAVITDSGSGLSEQEAKALGLFYLPLQIVVNDTMYLDGVDIQTEQLYDLLRQGAMPTTSMPPAGQMEALFEQLKAEGYDAAIAVPLTSGISSTASVLLATAKRHEIPLSIIECYSTCQLQRYLSQCAKLLVDKDMALEEIVRRLEASVARSNTLIIPDDLQHLKRGGRLTPLAAALGGLLKIKPILVLGNTSEGKIDVFDKVRTMSKAMEKAVATFQEANLDESYYTVVLHSDAPETSSKLKALMATAFPNSEMYYGRIGAVIASHTGLGCLGIQYIKKVEI